MCVHVVVRLLYDLCMRCFYVLCILVYVFVCVVYDVFMLCVNLRVLFNVCSNVLCKSCVWCVSVARTCLNMCVVFVLC